LSFATIFVVFAISLEISDIDWENSSKLSLRKSTSVIWEPVPSAYAGILPLFSLRILSVSSLGVTWVPSGRFTNSAPSSPDRYIEPFGSFINSRPFSLQFCYRVDSLFYTSICFHIAQTIFSS